MIRMKELTEEERKFIEEIFVPSDMAVMRMISIFINYSCIYLCQWKVRGKFTCVLLRWEGKELCFCLRLTHLGSNSVRQVWRLVWGIFCAYSSDLIFKFIYVQGAPWVGLWYFLGVRNWWQSLTSYKFDISDALCVPEQCSWWNVCVGLDRLFCVCVNVGYLVCVCEDQWTKFHVPSTQKKR